MKDDLNPKHSSDSSADPLAGALDELMEALSSQSPVLEWVPLGAPDDDDCPKPVEWLPLLGGESGITGNANLALAAHVDGLLAHAAECRKCLARLRILTTKPTEKEAAELTELVSATPGWERELAAELARTPRQKLGPIGIDRPKAAGISSGISAKRSSRIYLWTGSALAATLLIGAVTFFWWQRANSPERLLAEAYTQSRSYDLRMPGAGFADVTHETHLRGGGSVHESSRLLDARARIERQLENAPEDAHWLQLEARAEIQEEKFDPAIEILDRLLATEPVTAGLLVDDASAYFERGSSTGSENDRATALENLRRADELAPDNPLVLFNEAVVMEDRGQAMNAVETWNRYLKFEQDPRWLAEGRARLEALEQKLNQLKTHQSRMEQRLGSPQAMRALAADAAMLAGIDEELSSTLLPRLLNSAYPLLGDCSRGSPCGENCTEDCQASQTLLRALAESLNVNHQDPWLKQLLPSETSPSSSTSIFNQAARALAQGIDADVKGDYLGAQRETLEAGQKFHALGNHAGEDRAAVERSYALLRSSDVRGCYSAAHPLLGRDAEFAWIQIHDLTQDAYCDPAPGSAAENNPALVQAVKLAQDRHYALLELRARNLLGSAAVDARDSESAWRDYMATERRFYSGDFPAFRLYATLSGLQEVERDTPRVRVALLLQQEVLGVLGMTQSRELIPTERLNLAAAAIRAGAAGLAQEQMRLAQSELAANGGGKSVEGFLSETEVSMAKLDLEHRDLAAAAKMLDAANGHMAGEHNSYHRREYAVARGLLELSQGNPNTAEPMLREALLEEERLAGKGGEGSIVLAQQDRELYAVLAGVWLAQGRSGKDALSLWERYRLRVLGEVPPVCPSKGLNCMEPQLSEALARLGQNQLLGQVVLLDRILLYKASGGDVVWKQVPVGSSELLSTTAPLLLAVTSPATPMDAVDRAANRAGGILLSQLAQPEGSGGSRELLLEPDPLLGNLPWPAVATAAGPIGLEFDLEESPTLLLNAGADRGTASTAMGKSLVVGASVASGEGQLLPEVLKEARAVARFGDDPNLLLAEQATESQVAARLTTASTIHFAGHAAQQSGGTRLLLAPAKTAGMGLKDAIPDKPYLDSAMLRKYPPRAARLAVFSACSTGKKEEGWNHGMGDIVGTLASLGVPDVVATRWQIDSWSAVPMMDAFYGGLAQGLSVPQALTGARQALMRDARYRHPYYWAAYYASGSGRSDLRPIFHGSN